MELVNYLRAGNTVEDLKNKLHMKIRYDSEYPQLVLFHYDQIKSPKLHPIIKVSRGIILDSSDNWKIISYPYGRFFNYKEDGAAEIDIETMIVQEKLDGSILTLYNYQDQWRVSTSGITNAEGRTKSGILFYQLFDRVWEQLNYPDKSQLNKNYCYMFELCSNDNPIVIQHPQDRLILHGVRDITTLCELDPTEIRVQHGFEGPVTFTAADLEELNDCVDKYENIEGFVIVDGMFNRIKMKTSKYLNLHHTATARPGINLYESIIKIVQKNEGDEWLAKFPQHKEIYNKINDNFQLLLNEICDVYGKLIYKNQKSYALGVRLIKHRKILFAIRREKADPEQYMRTMDAKDLIIYLI